MNCIWSITSAELQKILEIRSDGGSVRRRKSQCRSDGGNEEVTVAVYEEKIYEKGVMQFFRGQPCVMPNGSRESGKSYLLTNGSLTTALYRAYKKRPFNKQVQLSVKQGLINCKVYHARTPKDVCDWLMEAHNDFHQGS